MLDSIGVTSATPDAGASTAVDSPSTQGADSISSGNVTTNQTVQDNATQQTTTEIDPLAGIPSAEEAAKMETVSKEAFLSLRGEYDKVAPQFKEIQPKWESYSPVLERFESPDQLQNTLGLATDLIGWERDAQSGELIPAVKAERLQQDYPLHADYLAADLLNGQTIDPQTGQRMSRMDVALSALSPSAVGRDPELVARRAEALRLLGAVEPSSISPQWQPTAEELENVPPELQDVYKKLPYEERQELKLASPDYIKSQLQKEKVFQELQADRQAAHQRDVAQAEARKEYIDSQAKQAGEQHLGSLLTDKLTAFHNSVVEKCQFIQPIDPQNPPQGFTAEQVQTMNAQIDQSNKAEAAQITGIVVALQNEQTRAFVLPLLKQIGVVDDKFLSDMDAAAHGLGNNARNYGELTFRGRLQSNGNGYQPDASVTGLGNEATRNLNRLINYANQLRDRLIEKRSQFFALKAQDHNQALNTVAGVRPSVQGSAYNPSTAATQTHDPRSPWPTRAQLEQQYG